MIYRLAVILIIFMCSCKTHTLSDEDAKIEFYKIIFKNEQDLIKKSGLIEVYSFNESESFLKKLRSHLLPLDHKKFITFKTFEMKQSEEEKQLTRRYHCKLTRINHSKYVIDLSSYYSPLSSKLVRYIMQYKDGQYQIVNCKTISNS